MPDNDLISRKALGISKCNPDVFNNRAYGEGWNACIAIIEAAPAVDAVPVVRCKDCWKRGYDNCPMDDYFDSHPMEPDCYCAHGEPEGKRPRSTCGPDYCEIGGEDDE